jgi:cellulose synthase/poly-beta-1,6-N-acetylglucosamine synthase-like glycosyltransferase
VSVPLFVCALALAFLSCLLFVYPYLLYPWLLSMRSKRPLARGDAPGDASRFALLFCAFNERETAREKLENLRKLKLRYPQLEILIYDDGSSDGCDGIYESVPGLVSIIRGGGRLGKAHGMKVLASRTTREFLVFTDANVTLQEDFVDQISKGFEDPEVGGICGHLEYQYQSRTATERVGNRYWALDEKLKMLESSSGNVMGGDGSIFSVRAELYPEFSDTVQDDFTVSMSVVFAGRRLIFEPSVIARERLVSSTSDEYRRKVRIAARAYHTHLAMRSSIRNMRLFDRWKYFSHKILRWYGGVFIAVAMLSVALASFLLSPWVLILVVVLALVSGLCAFMFTRTRSVLEILIAVLATTHGVALALRGRTFSTWVPPKSR